jgi:cardiolipin synthase A/B
MYTILCSGDTGVICPPRVRVLTWLVGAVALMVACAPVQRHFALPDLTISEPSFMPTLEALTGAAVTTGNEVDLLLNGDEIFPAQIAAIRAARDTITYAQYFYEDGPPAKQIAEALAERCRASIQVHILLDGFGTLAMPASYRELMERAGCQVATYRPVARLAWNRANNRNHRRVLVVDGLIGFTGGSGAARYFPPTGARGSMRAQIVRSSPAGGSYAMYTMFTLAMASARRSILITNPYFVPDADMVRIIAAAPARGTRVVLLLPGAIDNNIVRQASRSQFARLLEAGVEIYEYRAGLLHAKTMIVDGIWATLGSTNLDNRSFALNEELNIAVYSREFGARLERIFADDLEHSRRIDLAQWNSRGLRQRMLEWLSFPLRDQL